MKRKWWLFEFQHHRCYLCGVLMSKNRPSAHKKHLCVTQDHVRPKWRGYEREDNVLLAHRGCNETKGGRAPRACEVMYSDFAAQGWKENLERIARSESVQTMKSRILSAMRNLYGEDGVKLIKQQKKEMQDATNMEVRT